MKTDKRYAITESRYGDPLLTRNDLGPFQKYPERTSWIDFEVREYSNGDRVRYERECGRWSSVTQVGDWQIAGERQAAKLRAELERVRTDIGLYLHGLDKPTESPFPRFKIAPRPALGSETWLGYLREHAIKAPRIPEDVTEDRARREEEERERRKAQDSERERNRVIKGKRMRVVRGRKIPIGTEGIVSAYFPDSYGGVRLRLDDGTEAHTYDRNLEGARPVEEVAP